MTQSSGHNSTGVRPAPSAVEGETPVPLEVARASGGAETKQTEPAGNLAVKRTLDAALAAAGLLLSAPIWALLAAAIKLEDGGTVFFKHARVGKGGELFEAVKFRSMADDDHVPQQGHPDGELVTAVGSFMRACALDELPQLWNILKGEMSFVGPRPLPSREVTEEGEVVRLEEIEGWSARHRVRPGLTGIAQLRAPRDVSYRQKFRYDTFYVGNRSLALDLRLIARSLWVSLCGKWPEVGTSEGTTYL